MFNFLNVIANLCIPHSDGLSIHLLHFSKLDQTLYLPVLLYIDHITNAPSEMVIKET